MNAFIKIISLNNTYNMFRYVSKLKSLLANLRTPQGNYF